MRSSHLWLFASHRVYGSHVHTQRLSQGHASCLPDATEAALRQLPNFSGLREQAPFDITFRDSRQVIRSSLAFISFRIHVTGLSRLFQFRSLPRPAFWDTAANWSFAASALSATAVGLPPSSCAPRGTIHELREPRKLGCGKFGLGSPTTWQGRDRSCFTPPL